MMLRLLFAFLLAAVAMLPATAAQSPSAPADFWTRSDGRIRFEAAAISFPTQAGAVTLRRTIEFSRQGEGLDNALQFWTDDEEVFATVYVYYPGLPHAGVSAFATDHAIEIQSRDLRRLGRRLVGVGGRENVAIRADYAGFRDGMASSAAFIKAGRWIVKLRVSGPESRRRDVERTMSALLQGARFEGEATPRGPEPLSVADCSREASRAADLLSGTAADALEEAVIGILDGSGLNGRELNAEHSTAIPVVGPSWCLSSRVHVGETIIPILRTNADSSGEVLRTMLLAIVGDAGSMLEVVRDRRRSRFVVLVHRIGETRLLGAFDAVPSDEQIVNILTGSDRAGSELRATIIHQTSGDSDVSLHVSPDEPAAPTT